MTQYARRSVARSLIIVAVVSCLVLQTFVATVPATALTTPPQPAINTDSSNSTTNTAASASSSGPFKILASADSDPARNETMIPFTDYGPNGANTYNVSAGIPPFSFETTGLPNGKINALAPRTDGFRKQLSTDIHIPYEDKWVKPDETAIVSARNMTNKTVRTAGVNHEVVNGYYALGKSEPRNGWLPTRNALITGGSDPRIVNPWAVEVNKGKTVSYESRNSKAVSEFDTKPRIAKRPAGNSIGTNWFDGGGKIKFHSNFSERNITVLKNQWAGIARTSPGAFLDGQFIVSPDDVTVLAPSDFRLINPSNWETTLEDECKVTKRVSLPGTNNTTTRTEYYDVRKWEQLSIVDTKVTKRVSLGGDERRGRRATFNFGNPQSGTLQVSHRVEVTLQRRWGKDGEHPDCVSESYSETIGTKSIVADSTGVSVAQPDELSVTVHAIDREPTNELYITINGTQDLSGQPLGQIRLSPSGSKKSETIYGPWRFYPVSLYDSITKFVGDRKKTVPTTFGHPVGKKEAAHLYRDYAALGNWSKRGRLRYQVDKRTSSTNISDRSLPPGVVNRKGETPLYTRYAGKTYMTDAQLQNLQANAEDIFGNSIQTTVKHITYQESKIKMQNDGKTVHVRLFDPDTSTGISGAKLAVDGAKTSTVTTNASGWATVQSTTALVTVGFEGTDPMSGASTFYEKAYTSHYVRIFMLERSGDLYRWISGMIHQVLLVVEWAALLLFLMWYKLMFKPNRKSGQA
ncbi:hypothetical protein SAMN05216388_101381 [Halorientalis persicus]|uniref:Uncharacterized protein n=2 Tax=Halorientalis persicus TaxID=1367881 RepID=A0A1H8Q749_9EURY|nr:hypothetical protein SAMN05216388_101381 [Halorientalis persicus]